MNPSGRFLRNWFDEVDWEAKWLKKKREKSGFGPFTPIVGGVELVLRLSRGVASVRRYSAGEIFSSSPWPTTWSRLEYRAQHS